MSVALAETKEFYPRTINHETAEFDDTTTWLAEVLDGNMRTPFDYIYNGKDLVSKRDGRPIGKIFEDAVNRAELTVIDQPELDFELRRRRIELDEYFEMLEMVKDPESPNTMVVVSDFPEELKYGKSDVGGYNTTRQQTMLRVITRGSDGIVRMISQSLDRSDRDGLESIYGFFNVAPMRGELLGQRIRTNVDEKFHTKLPDALTTVYDKTLIQKLGGEWYAGRNPADYRNTYDFACRQTDLINEYLQTSRDDIAKRNLAAAIEARFEQRTTSSSKGSVLSPNNIVFTSPATEMEFYGRLAKEQGKTYSGCGLTITSSKEEMDALGYGDNDKKENLSWHGGVIKKGRCVNCKEDKQVGAKSWCRDCISGHCGTKK